MLLAPFPGTLQHLSHETEAHLVHLMMLKPKYTERSKKCRSALARPSNNIWSWGELLNNCSRDSMLDDSPWLSNLSKTSLTSVLCSVDVVGSLWITLRTLPIPWAKLSARKNEGQHRLERNHSYNTKLAFTLHVLAWVTCSTNFRLRSPHHAYSCASVFLCVFFY